MISGGGRAQGVLYQLFHDLRRHRPLRVVVAHHPPPADDLVELHGYARTPQEALQVWPGCSVIRSRPERKASGGQVIGLIPPDRRKGSPCRGSPVKTCHHLKLSSPQTVTCAEPSGAAIVTADPPSASKSTSPNVVSRAASPIRRGSVKSYSVPATLTAPIGSSRESASTRVLPGTLSRMSSTATPTSCRYGCTEYPQGAFASPVLVTSWSQRSPSAPTLQRVRRVSDHG